MCKAAAQREADELNVLEKAMNIIDTNLMKRVSLKSPGYLFELTNKFFHLRQR
jgi:hypothetical protein